MRFVLVGLTKTLETAGDLLAGTEFAGLLEYVLLDKLAATDVAKLGWLALGRIDRDGTAGDHGRIHGER